MTTCLSGCTYRGRHIGCDDDTCTGCEPRPADVGQLCTRCRSNLERDVRTAPSIVDWIREHVEPSWQWSERANVREIDAPAPLSVTAVDDADELHATLASWALLLMEEHPSKLHLRVSGARKTRRVRRTVYQAPHAAFCDDCGTVGYADTKEAARALLEPHSHAETQVRPNLNPWSEVMEIPVRDQGAMPHSEATTDVCRFLATHLDWCAQQDWAGEMCREIGSLVRTLLARYPQAERSRHLRDAKCRACGRTSMVYTPPSWAGGSILVQCEHGDCAAIVPESEFDWYMKLVEEDRKLEASA